MKKCQKIQILFFRFLQIFLSFISVHAVGSFEGRVFYDCDLTFPLGEGSEVCSSTVLIFQSISNRPAPFFINTQCVNVVIYGPHVMWLQSECTCNCDVHTVCHFPDFSTFSSTASPTVWTGRLGAWTRERSRSSISRAPSEFALFCTLTSLVKLWSKSVRYVCRLWL